MHVKNGTGHFAMRSSLVRRSACALAVLALGAHARMAGAQESPPSESEPASKDEPPAPPPPAPLPPAPLPPPAPPQEVPPDGPQATPRAAPPMVRVRMSGDHKGITLYLRNGNGVETLCRLPCEAAVPRGATIGVTSEEGTREVVVNWDEGVRQLRVKGTSDDQAVGAVLIAVGALATLGGAGMLIGALGGGLDAGGLELAGFALLLTGPIGIGLGASLASASGGLEVSKPRPVRDAHLGDARTRTAAAAAGAAPALPGIVQIPVGFSF